VADLPQAHHVILLSALEAYYRAYGIEIEEAYDLLQADEAVKYLMNFM